MGLSPDRSRPVLLNLRAAVRPRPLGVFAGLVVADALFATVLPQPLTFFAHAVAFGVWGSAITAEERRLRVSRRRLLRRPRVARPESAARVSAVQLRRWRRGILGTLIFVPVFTLGLVGALIWLNTEGAPEQRWEWWFYALLIPFLITMGVLERWTLQTLRRLPRDWREPPCPVTVLGFTGEAGADMVFVAGERPIAPLLSAPAPVVEDADRPVALTAAVGRRLGDVVAGDVLVCWGSPAEGRVVALATAEGVELTWALRVMPWSEICDR